jgi:hypothetical protein
MKLTTVATTFVAAAAVNNAAPLANSGVEARAAAPVTNAEAVVPEKRDAVPIQGEINKAKRAGGAELDVRDLSAE